MVKLFVNTDIQSIDREIAEVFSEYICQAEEESDIALVSRKTVLPGDIERLAQGSRKMILLVDSGDRDLIRAAKQFGVKDILFSPVKIDSIEKRIGEIIAEIQGIKESSGPAGKQAEIKQKEEKTDSAAAVDEGDEATVGEDALDELLACIKSRVSGSEELEALRRENEELKQQLKRYKDFVAVLTEILNKGGNSR